MGVMPPDGYTSLTVSDEVFEQLVTVMAEYDCGSIADAVETASTIALERDEAQLAQILADQLAE
jgi:hypothetical protein